MNDKTDINNSTIWKGGTLRCVARRDETHDSASFSLVSESSEKFDFQPGQFATIGVDVGGEMHYRAYSISSSPSEREQIVVTVKRLEGGVVSNFMIDQVREGATFDALPIAGEFHLDTANAPDSVVLLSSGSGITPVMGMARWLLEHSPSTRIHFVYSARSEDDIIFHDDLLTLAKQHSNFTLDLFLSKPRGGMACHAGRLTAERLSRLLSEAKTSHFYLCGHQSYMDMVEAWYAASGLLPEHFHKESFSPAALPVAEAGAREFDMSAPSFGKSGKILEGQSLLDAMEAQELPIIAACRSGVCGSCKCKVTSGEVEKLSTETLTPEEVENGFVLACSTLVHSDVSVEIVF